ncbi:MAG TPA: helical backbone metal receptor [Steroidobacteraceae bacterium]|nr:helical backbone metal receptor [Steroidobacteraceae bacterium]
MNLLRRFAPCCALLAAAAAFAAPATRSVHDDTGAEVTIGTDGCRIVSLAPGTTAMLYAAGAGHCLVGTIAHSKEPAEAASVPVVGDAETFDFERLLALRPTVVVVAVDVVQRVRIDRIRALGIPVYEVHVTSLALMPESVRRLGELAGTAEAAGKRADELRAELDALAERYRGRAPLRVLYQIWDRPIYTIGGRHVITDALRVCGARNVFAELSTAAPAVTREAVLARNPELVLVSAPPASAAEWVAEWRKFPSMSAVRSGNLVPWTDERMDRMGPSVIEATASLCEAIDRARPQK